MVNVCLPYDSQDACLGVHESLYLLRGLDQGHLVFVRQRQVAWQAQYVAVDAINRLPLSDRGAGSSHSREAIVLFPRLADTHIGRQLSLTSARGESQCRRVL